MTPGSKMDGRLRDPRSGDAIGPFAQPGYYPGYNTLAQQNFWDAKTREVVLDRVNNVPSIEFFSSAEADLLKIVCDHILPQDDRVPSRRIPIVPFIDRRLAQNRTDGYRFADTVPDPEAYRLGLEAIEEIAQRLHQKSFVELPAVDRDKIVLSLHDGKPAAGEEIWKRLPVKRFWSLLLGDCASIYYAHPWAWDEIGFGGPAYPRGYIRLEKGLPEPWETNEHRYRWLAPNSSVSDLPETGSDAAVGGRPPQSEAKVSDRLKKPIGGAFDEKKEDVHMLGAMQQLKGPWYRYGPDDEIDYVVIGVGAAGGVLLQRLARAGYRVVGIEAGPFWDSEKDWVSDEAGSSGLYWTDLRISGGDFPIAFGANNSGRGVGGSTVHWGATTPRFHPSDFRTFSQDGVGVDWPISYDDLKPYYELMELELPVSGPARYEWGDPHGYAFASHPAGGVAGVLARGAGALGIGVSLGGPVGILQGSRGDRPHCIYRGFCAQGCKVGAKASSLITHVPDAMANGAEIRPNCMVSRINMGDDGRVSGVTYLDANGIQRFQKAKAVIVSGYSIETPRLLLNSACEGHENGLANSSGKLGRFLMAQAANLFLARFDELIRMYKAPPANGLSEAFYETDASRGFKRGFGIHTIGPLPIGFAKSLAGASGAWGWGLRRLMMDYNHWAGLDMVGEILAHEDNRVELADETDRFGIPIAKITFNLHDNDKKLMAFAKEKITAILRAAGATEIYDTPRTAHLLGAARMGDDPATSVVDKFGRTHDVANLFICDGSICPTQGAANPGLTVMSLAARTADYLIAQGTRIFDGNERDMSTPRHRRDLSPPDTWGHGAPRAA